MIDDLDAILDENEIDQFLLQGDDLGQTSFFLQEEESFIDFNDCFDNSGSKMKDLMIEEFELKR